MLVWIARSALATAEVEAAGHAPHVESGGLLMGYWATPTEAVVTHATVPGPSARRLPNSFRPDYAHDEQQVARVWTETLAKSTYLGDWHSHTTGSGRLSWKDRAVMKRIAIDEDAAAPTPLMLVMIAQNGRWTPTAWVGGTAHFGPLSWLTSAEARVIPFDE